MKVEGAAFEDGRTPSIFDTFTQSSSNPGNGNVTSDQYHKYKEDVELMAETGLDAYRFSISWSRLIPNGRGPVNPKGLEYYNNLINALISKGIQPHVTLIHSDTPQALEDEYKGFLSPRIIEDFVAYADVCFREFGDRVLHWTTINEANVFIFGGYDAGNLPPSRCSFPFGINCTKGNSVVEPYLAAHHLLLAHASVARLYKDSYQGRQQGFIGFSFYTFGFSPFSNTTEDVTATQRAYVFFIGWFMEPLMYGDYPAIMKKNAGSKLPVFTRNETELLKESFDFIGLNYYTVARIKDNSAILTKKTRDYLADQATTWIFIGGGSDPFSETQFMNTPWGLQGVLEHFKQAYGNPPVYIHENGSSLDVSLLDNIYDITNIPNLTNNVNTLSTISPVSNSVIPDSILHANHDAPHSLPRIVPAPAPIPASASHVRDDTPFSENSDVILDGDPRSLSGGDDKGMPNHGHQVRSSNEGYDKSLSGDVDSMEY
ncbi:hypothetical protein KSS87_002911 [Heliosperma pusillum]|nr:hypothetical protein KSS87_002911 [Heliosperma pusillum]